MHGEGLGEGFFGKRRAALCESGGPGDDMILLSLAAVCRAGYSGASRGRLHARNFHDAEVCPRSPRGAVGPGREVWRDPDGTPHNDEFAFKTAV